MPKAILDVSLYDGGMNSHNNPRDLEENELTLVQNGVVTNKGMIRTGYKESTGLSGSITFDPPDGTALWVVHSDYKHDNTEEFTEHILVGSQRYVKRLEGSSWNTIIDLTSAAPATNHLGFVAYDGQIRFCNGTYGLNNNSQPVTETKLYYQFDRKYFNANSLTIDELGSGVSSSIVKPDNGQVAFNSAVDVTSSLRGYLGLRVNKKDDIVRETIDISSSAVDGTAGSGTYADSTVQEFAMELASISIDNSLIIDTHDKSYAPTSSDLFFGGTNTSTSTISGSTWTIELDNANEGFYIPLTIGEDFETANYGSSSTRKFYMVATANIEQYSTTGGNWVNLANNWAGLGTTFTYQAQKYDESTSSWTDISSTISNSGSGGQKRFLVENATDSKFRMKIKLASFNTGYIKVKVELTASFLQAHLFPDTGDSNFHIQNKLTSSSVDYEQRKFDNAIESDNLIDGNLLSLKVAVPHNYPNTKEVRIRLSQSTSNLDDAFIYTLSNNWVINARNKGWQEVLIPLSEMLVDSGSPTLSSCKHLRLSVIGASNQTTSRVFYDSVKVIKDDRGTWDGDYKFFYSWIYDRAQESGFFEFPNQGNGMSLSTKKITAQAFIRELSAGGFSNGSKRITGANVYFAEYDKDTDALKYEDPFFLMKVDLERGVSHPNGNVLNIWTSSGDHKTHDVIEFINPPYSSSFSINSGYTYNSIDHIDKIKFRDATVMNRRIYYGNVELLHEKHGGESYALREQFQDRVYKSLINKPDIVPSTNYIDVVTNDGDEINALESYADRLLVFKNNSMLLINATRDVEFLEDTYIHKGVWGKSAVEKTDNGIAWANQNGAYFYDGEKVIELSYKKIDQGEWNTAISTKPTVVFEPKNRHLIVSSTNSTNDGWLCDLEKMSWVRLDNYKTNDSTNMVIYNDEIQYGVYGDHDDDGATANRVHFKKITFDKTASVSGNPIIKFNTRDITINSSGQRFDLKKVYVSYKGTPGSMDIKYRTNGESTPTKSFTNNDSWGASGSVKTISFVPSTKSEAKDIHSLKLLFNDSGATNVGMNFELHDISIVYRARKVK
jgi:hypothetical protein